MPAETSDADRLRFQVTGDREARHQGGRIRATFKSAYGLVTARTNTN
ncbi:hypothetical protein [Chamaesiphon minutus]|nr:hypothetical protein [Chamaesiphon minutus]